MRRVVTATAAVLGAVVVFLIATLPTAPVRLAHVDPALAERTVPGAFHVHSTDSDGGADRAAIAVAASRAGLRFVIFTDHGDATSPPRPPQYVGGVLCIDGVEISTNGGHYVAVDLRQAAPYPLGGEAAAVVEDVARIGGFGVAAHPGSSKPALRWLDRSAPVDGVEWLNADSEWRDEPRPRLVRTLLDYLVRPAPALASLLDRPADTLARWDAAASQRRVLGLAGHDAHGGIGRRADEGPGRESPRGMRLGLPSYQASFSTFSTRVVLDRPFDGTAKDDAARLLAAVRAGRTFTAIDAIAQPSTLRFTARQGSRDGEMGDVLPEAPTTFSATAEVPAGATIVLLHNGKDLAAADGGVLAAQGSAPGSYRVEVRLAGAPGTPPVPWLVSNPVFLLPPPPGPAAHPPDIQAVAAALPPPLWHVEKERASLGSLSASEAGLALDYALAPGARRSQFVAVAADLPPALGTYDRITFEGRAGQPMRLSMQLRFGSGADVRWGHSVYLEPSWRRISVPLEALVPVGEVRARPEWRRATSLLLVIDLTNAGPGTRGRVEVREAALTSSGSLVH